MRKKHVYSSSPIQLHEKMFTYGVTRCHGLLTQGGALFLVNSLKFDSRVEKVKLFENFDQFSETILFFPRRTRISMSEI